MHMMDILEYHVPLCRKKYVLLRNNKKLYGMGLNIIQYYISLSPSSVRRLGVIIIVIAMSNSPGGGYLIMTTMMMGVQENVQL